MGIRVLIETLDVTDKLVGEGVVLTRAEMAVQRATVKLYEQEYSIGDTLYVYEDETLRFQGEIDKERIQPGEFTCFASDKSIVLSDEAATNDSHRIYEAEAYEDIITDLLDYYLSGVFDVTNVDATGKSAAYLDLTSKPIYECMKIVSQRARFAWWLVPPNYLYFKAIDTVSSGYSAIYGTNIEKIDVTRDNFVKTKVVVVFQLNNRKAFTERGDGSRIVLISDDTINNEADANDLGDALLAELQDIRIRGQITLTEPRFDLIPGTTIVVHAPQFGFSNEVVRIKQVQVTPFSTRISVGTVGAMVDDTLVDFEERLRNIESRGLEWLLSCTTLTQTAPGCAGQCEVVCEHACEAVCEPTCEAVCQSGCQFGSCQTGVCQTDCQLNEQISCVTDEQVCGSAGTCQVACEAGHSCETICQSQCQNYCQTGDCQIGCETGCETTCETTCQDACQTTCQLGCETSCQTTCQTTCQSTCEIYCQTGCETACDGTCEVGCKIGCETETLCCGTIGPY